MNDNEFEVINDLMKEMYQDEQIIFRSSNYVTVIRVVRGNDFIEMPLFIAGKIGQNFSLRRRVREAFRTLRGR